MILHNFHSVKSGITSLFSMEIGKNVNLIFFAHFNQKRDRPWFSPESKSSKKTTGSPLPADTCIQTCMWLFVCSGLWQAFSWMSPRCFPTEINYTCQWPSICMACIDPAAEGLEMSCSEVTVLVLASGLNLDMKAHHLLPASKKGVLLVFAVSWKQAAS